VDGFLLEPDLLSVAEEAQLVDFIGGVSFGEVRMHGVTAKRRVAQFGWRYAFETFRLTPGPPIPDALLEVRRRAGLFAGVPAEDFSEVLVTEYRPGAGIGWHHDAPHFGIVAGVSLGGACRMRFRRGETRNWQTEAVALPPRSLYLLTGSARREWQHMIPPVHELRSSITFRTVRPARAGGS
jgi:alkylated DNA repair protein (DNA oxidative demethylase)